MPTVGKKKFPYTKKGKAAAKKAKKKVSKKGFSQSKFDKMKGKVFGLAKKEDKGLV